MTEDFIQFLWKYGYYKKDDLHTLEGERVKVINPGEWNQHAGPDFFNAKIQIGETTWAGNVEIHLRSSDWDKHKHNSDPAYDNVILHVVHKNDTQAHTASGHALPTIELAYDPAYESRYHQLRQNKRWVACERFLPAINKFEIHFWLGKLAIERLESKSATIQHTLEETKNNWEESFYIQLARSFGLKENTLAFEMLAKSLPLITLAKHKAQLFQIEALIFGQAGMLNQANEEDQHYEAYRKEYAFLRQKHRLTPIANHLWKYLRLRPSNFPEIRLAQFAMLVYKSTSLLSKVLETDTMQELEKMFELTASEYWDTHYRFGAPSRKMKKKLGKTTIENLLINTVIPFIFVYGNMKRLEPFKERAVALLEEMKPEKNSIVQRWNELGIETSSAFYSQAAIQLKREYCEKLRCLNCKIGNEIIASV